jgi:hypothetical protein
MSGLERLGEAVRLWGVLGARAVECRRLGLFDCREVAKLQTGQRVSVTWSGGNGPHEYVVFRTIYGDVVACMPVLHFFVGYIEHVGPHPLTQVRLVEDRS